MKANDRAADAKTSAAPTLNAVQSAPAPSIDHAVVSSEVKAGASKSAESSSVHASMPAAVADQSASAAPRPKGKENGQANDKGKGVGKQQPQAQTASPPSKSKKQKEKNVLR